jgi:hypothetical protein
MLDTPDIDREQAEGATPNWAADAPRGGKTVMNRILKENATVPLFFAQTLIASIMLGDAVLGPDNAIPR